MKILYVYGFFSHGGCETVLYNRKTALTRLGIECHLLFMAPNLTNVFNSDRQTFFFNDPTSIRALLNRNRYSLIAVLDCPAFYPILAETRYEGAVITECHTSNGSYLEYVRSLVRFNYPDAFITPSPSLAKTLRENYRTAAPVFVIPNGLDCTFFDYRSQTPPAWPKPLPDDHKVLCWIGRLEEAKNPLAFLGLARGLKDADPRLAVWMVSGKTYLPLHRQVMAAVRDYGLQPSFAWLPAIPYRQMPVLYSRVARSGGCLVSTSERECYPMILLEAAACRCPVAGTDIDGHRAIIEPGITGLLFPPGDQPAARRRVESLLYDLSLRESITANAYARVRQYNDITRITGIMLDTYKAILAGK